MKSENVLIIAEAGVNHNGDPELARKLIDVAAEAGADMVKFQSFRAERLVSPHARKAEYQSRNFDEGDDTQYSMLKNLELTHELHIDLIEYCKTKNIRFLSTAFDADTVDYLDSLGLPFFKVPSGEITNYPYLKRIAEKGRPVFLSTGMATMMEVKQAVEVITKNGLEKTQITVLHCNTEYPTPMEDVNLRAMQTMEAELAVKVGYSDHTVGIEVPVAAVALGASVIEKHFTLDRSLPGPDHKASLEPDELKAMVNAIRNIEAAMVGSGEKTPSKSEMKNIIVARKSIYLIHDIKAGQVLTEDDLIPLRPGDGISPMEWNKVIGKKAVVPLAKFDQLTWEHLE